MSTPLLALYALVRGLLYASLLLLVGSQAARSLIRKSFSNDRDAARPLHDAVDRFARRLALLLALLIVVRGALQIRSLLDPGDPITADIVSSVLLTGPWGRAWLLQLGAALVLVALLRLRSARRVSSSSPVAAIVAVLVWAQTGMGHSATNRWPPFVGRLLDGSHLLGAGLWLGTLGILAFFALPLLRSDAKIPTLAQLVRGFSTLARVGVLLVLISGTVATLVYAQSLPLLLASTWGRLLAVKVIAMLGVLALGWYNWRVVTPALEGNHANAGARLRATIRLELLLAFAMLAITTLLVVSPLPGEV